MGGETNLSRVLRHRLALSICRCAPIDLLIGDTVLEMGVGGRRSGEGETSLRRRSSDCVSKRSHCLLPDVPSESQHSDSSPSRLPRVLESVNGVRGAGLLHDFPGVDKDTFPFALAKAKASFNIRSKVRRDPKCAMSSAGSLYVRPYLAMSSFMRCCSRSVSLRLHSSTTL